MAKFPLPLLAGGAAIAALVLLAKKAPDLVTGKSGSKWRVALLATDGAVKTWEVFAPAGQFGPHAEMSVIRYTQAGSDMASRKVIGQGAGVPNEVVAVAKSDFGAV